MTGPSSFQYPVHGLHVARLVLVRRRCIRRHHHARIVTLELELDRRVHQVDEVGNLFFDQTQAINLRQYFVDRYVVYNNQLLSVELLATYRDGSQQARPMTPEEKRDLLKTLFGLSYWEQ